MKWRKNEVEEKNEVEGEKIEVEISGFEPEASRMQSERSTTELYPQLDKRFLRMLFIAYPLLAHVQCMRAQSRRDVRRYIIFIVLM